MLSVAEAAAQVSGSTGKLRAPLHLTQFVRELRSGAWDRLRAPAATKKSLFSLLLDGGMAWSVLKPAARLVARALAPKDLPTHHSLWGNVRPVRNPQAPEGARYRPIFLPLGPPAGSPGVCRVRTGLHEVRGRLLLRFGLLRSRPNPRL